LTDNREREGGREYIHRTRCEEGEKAEKGVAISTITVVGGRPMSRCGYGGGKVGCCLYFKVGEKRGTKKRRRKEEVREAGEAGGTTSLV
jgi:hypothetical protein